MGKSVKAWLQSFIGRFLWLVQLPIITKDHTLTFHVIALLPWPGCFTTLRCDGAAKFAALRISAGRPWAPCTAQWLWRLHRWRCLENIGVMLFNPALHCYRPHGCHELLSHLRLLRQGLRSWGNWWRKLIAVSTKVCFSCSEKLEIAKYYSTMCCLNTVQRWIFPPEIVELDYPGCTSLYVQADDR